MNNVKEQLFKLQINQLEHDEFFHKEITRLNAHQRINHMALHFAKYSGQICDAILNTKDNQSLIKIIIDSFIISVTCANILNVRISDKVVPLAENQCSDFVELGRIIANHLRINTEDSLWLVKTFPIVVGELAKACESIDHLEPYDYRDKITICVSKICSLMLIAAMWLKIDLISEVPLRLIEVKKKSVFYDYFINR